MTRWLAQDCGGSPPALVASPGGSLGLYLDDSAASSFSNDDYDAHLALQIATSNAGKLILRFKVNHVPLAFSLVRSRFNGPHGVLMDPVSPSFSRLPNIFWDRPSLWTRCSFSLDFNYYLLLLRARWWWSQPCLRFCSASQGRIGSAGRRRRTATRRVTSIRRRPRSRPTTWTCQDRRRPPPRRWPVTTWRWRRAPPSRRRRAPVPSPPASAPPASTATSQWSVCGLQVELSQNPPIPLGMYSIMEATLTKHHKVQSSPFQPMKPHPRMGNTVNTFLNSPTWWTVFGRKTHLCRPATIGRFIWSYHPYSRDGRCTHIWDTMTFDLRPKRATEIRLRSPIVYNSQRQPIASTANLGSRISRTFSQLTTNSIIRNYTW